MNTSNTKSVNSELVKLKNKTKANDLQRFFQTGPGGYGEGDLFLGITVPNIRSVARKYPKLTFDELGELLRSEFHEVRFCALVVLTERYKKSKEVSEKKKIYDFYLSNIKSGAVNNWDLIDIPASQIGEYLMHIKNPVDELLKLAKSKSLWVRRSAVIFTFPFIKRGKFEPTLIICDYLIEDKHDLIHKATGWALREVGNRNPRALRSFLDENLDDMPRTMLRYAIEKLPEAERKRWLKGSVAN
jgi:3-methyladenine DNA glycosylase AlkD